MSIVDKDSLNPSAIVEAADIETSTDAYAERFTGRVGAWMLNIQEKIVMDMIRDIKPDRILDVGGGHGQLAIPLCRAGYSVTVLGSAASCQNRIQAFVENQQCDFKVGNMIDLPYDDQSFDIVIAFRLATHCKQWPLLLKELARVARKAVIIDYPTKQSINALAPLLFKAKKKIEKNTRNWTTFTDREILDAFPADTFKLGQRKKEFFLPMVLHRMLKCRSCSAILEKLFRVIGLNWLWGSPVIVRMDRTS